MDAIIVCRNLFASCRVEQSKRVAQKNKKCQNYFALQNETSRQKIETNVIKKNTYYIVSAVVGLLFASNQSWGAILTQHGCGWK